MIPNQNTIKNWDDLWTKTGYKYPEMKPVNERKEKVASLIPKAVRVIDVAAGVGQIRQSLHPSVSYIALDFSLIALKMNKGTRIQADINALPVKPKSVHTVIAMEILEHVDNPVTFLKRIAALANRQIIISVPDNRLPPDENGWHRTTYTA
ncbi:methyltransferase domain-containing protein, partial [bacterium]|nr:methyltransferase domain-containing protein [bacterium]